MKILCSLALIAFLITGIGGCSSSSIKVNVGESAPSARLYLLNGDIRTTSDYLGKDLILIFWASTCSHSYSVLKDLVAWQSHSPLAKRTNIVSVSIDKADHEDKLRELVAKLGKNKIDHAFSANDVYDEAYVAFDIGQLPTLVLVDSNGKVKAAGTSLGDVTE